MRWPWFDDIAIERVLKGQAPTGRVTVQMLQHTYLIAAHVGRWPLRRNELGGFNVLDGEFDQMTVCPPNTPPARSYIRPTNGRSIADLIKEGEQRYGEGPDRPH